MASFFELAPRLYEVERVDAKLLRHSDKIRLMSFEKTQQCGQQPRIVRTTSQLIRPDSGQIDEPLRPSVVSRALPQERQGQVRLGHCR